MTRLIAVAGLTIAILGCLPAHAQEATPELEGAPGSFAVGAPPPLKVPAKAPTKAIATPDKANLEQARLAQQAESQKALEARLARQAEELRAQQAKLDARAAELAAEERRIERLRLAAAARQSAEERRLAQLRADAQANLSAQRAELTRAQQEPARAAAPDELAPPPAIAPEVSTEAPPPAVLHRAPTRDDVASWQASSARLVFAAARRSCTWAAEQAARARDYDDARYDDEPQLYQRDGWELRGRMRLQDWRGYRLVDTVCKVDDAGEVEHFALLR